MPFWNMGMFYITVSGGPTVAQKIRQFDVLGARVESLEEPLTQIGEDFQDSFSLNFATEGETFGGGWKPLAESTIKDRIRKGFGSGPMMWRTGDMRNSIVNRGAPGNIFEVTKDSLRVGTSDRIAAIHQSGSKTRPDHPPKRIVVGVSWEMRSMIVKRLGDWAREQVVASGLSSGGGAL